ncbi:MAG: YncE family protein [Bacteroidales bacterium]
MEKKLKHYTYKILVLFLIVSLTGSCEDDEFGEEHDDNNTYTHKEGLFIINEGNYSSGNGSLSFYNPANKTLSNEVFYSANERPLGDIPFEIEFLNNHAIISVNNAGKIEVVDLTDFASVKTITGLSSPRHIQPAASGKIFISDLESSNMHIINSNNYEYDSSLDAGKSTGAMVYNKDLIFACNWSEFYVNEPNNTITVIDPVSESIIKTIPVAKEPNSIVTDKNDMLWVLSSGGYNHDEVPALTQIDPEQLAVLQSIPFPQQEISPEDLTINEHGDSLFFTNKGIYGMSINDTVIPTQEYIKKANRNINSLAIDPDNGDLYFSNALDYQQKGWILRYDRNTQTVCDSFRVGINPGAMKFYTP